MKKVISYCSAIGLAAVLSGCVTGMGPTGAVSGFVYTDVSGPVTGTSGGTSTKMGQAEATGIICVATGDASIKAACANGGITKIHHVDYHTTSCLGVYAKTIVTVYGE
jgi:hypothetical protein